MESTIEVHPSRPRRRERRCRLPIGYRDRAGEIHREVVLRKMTGHEEALLYDPNLNPGQLVTELLLSCVQQLGNLSAVNRDCIADLYIPDRNTLLLELRRLSVGDQLPATYSCTSCGGTTRVVEDLSTIPIRESEQEGPPPNVALQLEDGYEDHKGRVHTELVLRIPKGSDEEFVAQAAATDPLRARDALVLRTIERFGQLSAEELSAFGFKAIRELTLSDRGALFAALDTRFPGPDFRREITCAVCGAAFRAILDVRDFFVVG